MRQPFFETSPTKRTIVGLPQCDSPTITYYDNPTKKRHGKRPPFYCAVEKKNVLPATIIPHISSFYGKTKKMPSSKPLPERKTPRATWHDYNRATYFVTICTKNRQHYFGNIQNGVPKLTAIGEYTQQCVKQIPKIHTDVEIPIFTVMPNHIHLIVVLRHTNRRAVALRQPYNNVLRQPHNKQNVDPEMQRRAKCCGRLSHIIGQFKSAVIREAQRQGIPFAWQARFHDHIIRNNGELERIALYIKNNPTNWKGDGIYTNGL